jgi:hypothetical protein
MATGNWMSYNPKPAQGWATIGVKFDTKDITGLLKGDHNLAIPGLTTDPMAKAMAFGAREGLSYILSRGYRIAGRTVAATETASKTMDVAEMAASPFGNGRGYAVYEGSSKTIYIRTGSPPQGRPPISVIKEWIVAKGLSSFESNSPSPLEHNTRWRDGITQLAWRIAMGIKKRGTSTWHKPMYPSNSRRFDYVGFAVKKLRMLDELFSMLQASFPELNKLLVGYLRSGKWNANSAFTKIKLKNYRPPG